MPNSGHLDALSELDLLAWDHELERRQGVRRSTLRDGGIACVTSERTQVIWSATGAAVACSDSDLAAALADAVSQGPRDEFASLAPKLSHILKQRLAPGECLLDLSLYWRRPPGDLPEYAENVELLSREESGLFDLPETVEHVFAVRRGGELLSWASNIPLIEVRDHWLHSIRVETEPEHRRKGLGRAVVSALLNHIGSEGGAAIWVCRANNAPSVHLAFGLGFIWHFTVLTWHPADSRRRTSPL